MSEDAESEGLCVDVDTGVVRRDRVLVQRTPIATLFIGFGAKSQQLRDFACGEEEDRDPFIARCREIDAGIESGRLAKAHRFDLPRSAFVLNDRVLRRLAIAEALSKAGFNPDEPRDERGRWTTEGDNTPALQEGRSVAVTTVAASAADDFADTLEGWSGWSFGSAGREALAALGRFAAGAIASSVEGTAAAITALGILIIPTNRDTTSRGTLRDRPDIGYTFDAPAGVLTLSRDGEVFYAGRLQGGAFRDDRGRIFGYLLRGKVVVDPDILPPPVWIPVPANPGSDPRRGSKPKAVSTTDQPRLCPDPTPEPDWKGRSERTLQYQEQITSLPRGVDVEFREVRFDGCRESDGTMLEAKGEGFEWALLRGGFRFFNMEPELTFFKNYGGEKSIMEQAFRQSEAAPDRRIEWHFAEELVADYFRMEFERAKYTNITVIYEPYRRTKKWADCFRKYMSIGATVLRAPPLALLD